MFIEFGTSRSRSATSFVSRDPSVPDVLTRLSVFVRRALDYGQMSALRRRTPLKPTLMRRRPRRRRDLTPGEWKILRDLVTQLDRDAVLRWAQETAGMAPITLYGDRIGVTANKIEVCPAVVMDPSELGSCWGEWRQDHVKDDPKLGEKAPDDIWHLVNLCAGHDERGMKAGHVWNTANRDKERRYLRENRPERPGSGGSGA